MTSRNISLAAPAFVIALVEGEGIMACGPYCKECLAKNDTHKKNEIILENYFRNDASNQKNDQIAKEWTDDRKLGDNFKPQFTFQQRQGSSRDKQLDKLM